MSLFYNSLRATQDSEPKAVIMLSRSRWFASKKIRGFLAENDVRMVQGNQSWI
jgi:hypothetical protein